MTEHSELAYSWPMIPFAAGLLLIIPLAITGLRSMEAIAAGLMVFAFVPCCFIRDWWVGRPMVEP